MERIKQALEQAREERLRAGGEIAGRLASGRILPPEEQITYTRTRTQLVDGHALREQRVIPDGVNNYADAFRMLRTQILQRLRENHWSTIAVTSTREKEGKTTTAVNLALSLAQEVSYTVLLVDADLRQPAVHQMFGLDNPPGLSDYLQHDRPLEELLIHPQGVQRFVFLPGGEAVSNSAEMLNSPKMTRLVEELKHRYPKRIVIFDLPALLNTSDTLAFSPYVDAALLVIEDGKTPAQDIQQALDMIKQTRLLGTVLTKSHSLSAQGDKRQGITANLIRKLEDAEAEDGARGGLLKQIVRLFRRG